MEQKKINEQKADDKFVSQPIAKPHVVRSHSCQQTENYILVLEILALSSWIFTIFLLFG